MVKSSQLFTDTEERAYIKSVIDMFEGTIVKIINKNGDDILKYIVDTNRHG